MLALGVAAAAVGAVLGSGAVQSLPVDGVTLYRVMMLVGLLSLAYLQFRN